MATIKEIALLADVSPATVSRVINGTAKVDEEKRKVMDVLGQIQNSYAIRDMQLEEISTEEVIRKIYEGANAETGDEAAASEAGEGGGAQ